MELEIQMQGHSNSLAVNTKPLTCHLSHSHFCTLETHVFKLIKSLQKCRRICVPLLLLNKLVMVSFQKFLKPLSNTYDLG